MNAILQPATDVEGMTAPTVLRIAEVNDGAAILDDVRTFLCRFVAFSCPEQADAVALWIVHSHAFDAAETTPRLSIQSAEKRSGKTRVLELLDLLVCSPVSTASISAAALFRIVAEAPTLLVDEIDSVFSARGSGAEDLRGLLNAGYRRGGGVIRSSAGRRGTIRYDVFAPVVLAGIGKLPDTIADRSIPIRMKRRADGEAIERFRRRDVEPEAEELRERISTWADEHLDVLATLRPEMPEALDDRATDIWEPLLAIASFAGEEWSRRAAAAAIALSVQAADDDAGSDGVRLLADLRSAFDLLQRERVSSAELVRMLSEMEDAPWGEHGLDAHALARMLRPYEVKPRLVRVGETVFRGYVRSDFEDTFGRYLPG